MRNSSAPMPGSAQIQYKTRKCSCKAIVQLCKAKKPRKQNAKRNMAHVLQCSATKTCSAVNKQCCKENNAANKAANTAELQSNVAAKNNPIETSHIIRDNTITISVQHYTMRQQCMEDPINVSAMLKHDMFWHRQNDCSSPHSQTISTPHLISLEVSTQSLSFLS